MALELWDGVAPPRSPPQNRLSKLVQTVILKSEGFRMIDFVSHSKTAFERSDFVHFKTFLKHSFVPNRIGGRSRED